MKKAFLVLSLLVAAHAADAQTPARADTASTWRIDPGHSELTFSIRHLISRVRGQFNRWEGSITGRLDAPQSAVVTVTADAASIDTNHENRDRDLRGSDFFDADNHPQITFRSTRIESTGNRVRVAGDLTMRGITKPVVLEGTFVGTTRDQRGRLRAGFEVSGTIDRRDWGLVWNRALEAGGVLLGDDVRIDAVLSVVQQ